MAELKRIEEEVPTAAQPSEPGRDRAWLGHNGEPLTVQKELMRQASIQTTLNTYGGGMMESMRGSAWESGEAGDSALMDVSGRQRID